MYCTTHPGLLTGGTMKRPKNFTPSLLSAEFKRGYFSYIVLWVGIHLHNTAHRVRDSVTIRRYTGWGGGIVLNTHMVWMT